MRPVVNRQSANAMDHVLFPFACRTIAPLPPVTEAVSSVDRQRSHPRRQRL